MKAVLDSRTDVVIRRREEDLRLTLEPPESERMDDSRLVPEVRTSDIFLSLTQPRAILFL